MSSNVDSLFAYGTLKNLSLLRKWMVEPVSVQDAFIIGRLYRAGWYPVYIEDPTGFKVYGKLIKARGLPSAINKIDYYEGYSPADPQSLFIRKRMTVTLLEEGEEEAWVYVGNPRNHYIRSVCKPENLIRDGRWKP